MTEARQARQERAAERSRAIRVVLWSILAANWAVAAAKVALGLAIGSTSMTADGLHSFIDGGSNVIGLVAMHFASQPPDREHPYGHQKFEALAALAIGVMIGMGVLELGRMAWGAIVHGTHPTVGPLAVGVMLGTLAINLVVTRVERSWGEKLGSALLLADARHTLSDVFVTAAVLSSLALSWLGVRRVDGVVALAVLVFVAWTGWTILRQAVGILADTARIEPQKIREAVLALPEVLAVHDVRSRGMEGSVYVDLKIDVDSAATVEHAHRLSDAVEEALTQAFPEIVDVVVHVEPRVR
ncbi:MAG: cation transporter [Myxococcales bacterium]|nr:cation transporter [Myxococcales bacterium]